MKDLFQLMIDLAVDPQKQALFECDPSLITADLRLSDTTLMRRNSGNRAQIKAVSRE